MPRKPRGNSFTGSITLTNGSTYHFGDTVPFTYTSTDPFPWAHYTIRDANGYLLEEGYINLLIQDKSLVCGPTPLWPSGGGNGKLDLVVFNNSTGNFNIDKPYASVTFTVLP